MRMRGQDRINEQIDRMTKELNLSQEQQTQVRQIMTDHQTQADEQMRTRMTENREKMQEIRKQMQEARAAGDQEKIKSLEDQMREMWRGGRDSARQQLMTDIEAILSPSQKTKFEQIKDDLFGFRVPLEERPDMLLQAVESIKLNPDKEQKIKGIIDEWTAKYRRARGDRSARRDRSTPEDQQQPPRDREAYRKEREASNAAAAEVYKKVMSELTPEQQEAVKAWRPEPRFDRSQRGEGRRGGDREDGRGRRGSRGGDRGRDRGGDAAQPQ